MGTTLDHGTTKGNGSQDAANEELQGKPDDLDTFTEPEAEGMAALVREYCHHVYVLPDKLANF